MRTIPNIEITQVANGWIVILNSIQKNPFTMEAMTEMAKNVAQSVERDPLLSSLEEKKITEELNVIDYKDNNIHIFKTFEEVLGFLKFNFSK